MSSIELNLMFDWLEAGVFAITLVAIFISYLSWKLQQPLSEEEREKFRRDYDLESGTHI